MGYLTESRLKSVIDLPISLPDTTVKQSDYLVVATVNLTAGQRLSLRSMTLQMLSSTVTNSLVDPTNKIVANLGLLYAVLRQNYVSGTPGSTGALDTIFLTDIGVVSRTLPPVYVTTPGYYSIIVANNMQGSNTSPIPTSTSIDFKAVLTGQFRLELNFS